MRCDLFIGTAFGLEEEERCALVLGQGGERLVQAPEGLGEQQPLFGIKLG